MYSISIVEDDLSAYNLLKDYLGRYEKDHKISFLIKNFTSGEMFLDTYTPIDIVFMDIELPGLNGLDVCKKLRKIDSKVVIIFVTNMAQFAINGYEVEALDFIVKPLMYSPFETKFSKALEKVSSLSQEKLTLRINRKDVFVNIPDILFIEVRDHNLVFHTKQEEFTMRGSLNEYEQLLKDKNFYPCSNYCLVNLAAVYGVQHDEVQVLDQKVHITRNKKKAFLEKLSNFIGRN